MSDSIRSWQTQRGIARYFGKIVEAVVADFGPQATIVSSQNLNCGPARHVKAWRVPGRPRLNNFLQGAAASLASWAGLSGLFYSPYFGNAKVLGPQLFTVYDMIHELQPGYFDRAVPVNKTLVEEKKRCIDRAAALIAISQKTASDMMACYPNTDAGKIRVIHLGVDDEFFCDGDGAGLPADRRPYLLYVGHRTRYKNFLRLLAAYGQSSISRDLDLLVLSPSGGGWGPAERALLEKHALQDHVILKTNATDAELKAAYQESVALVYPSECEGFGLPILEAMACGTLVVASNLAPMTEVGGSHAFYFDPLDINDLSQGLQEVVALSGPERQAKIHQGQAWARQFTWTACQRQTLELFHQFI